VLVDMSVQDNGRGMSESELDALFQDFEQVLDDEETTLLVCTVTMENLTWNL
jgi:K+-sensing histidine kinase KdpD